MRFLAFSAMTVAFMATVSAKFDIGRCRTDVPQLSYEDVDTGDYEWDFRVPFERRFLAIDRQFEDLIAALTNFGFKMPLDYECDQLGAIEPFKSLAEEQKEADEDLDTPLDLYDDVNFHWEEDLFNLWFPEREDAVLRMVAYFELPDDDPPTAVLGYEQWYLCIDSFSLDAVIEQNEAFGLERTSGSSFFVSLTSLFDIFKKLNMSFKVHGGIIFGENEGASGHEDLIEETAYDLEGFEIPGYNFANYVAVTGADDYCGVEL